MKNVNLAEELKNKRQIVEFRHRGRKGRKSSRLTPRQRSLEDFYKEHGDWQSLANDLPPALRGAYLIRGHWHDDKSSTDLKADHIALVRAGLLEWRPVGGSADGLYVRVPCDHEHRHGLKSNEYKWCAAGFVVETAENRWTPYRLSGLRVRASARPDARCKCVTLYDCLPADHGVRLEDISLSQEARQQYPTPGSVFAACMELYKLGSVEVEPLGLDG